MSRLNELNIMFGLIQLLYSENLQEVGLEVLSCVRKKRGNCSTVYSTVLAFSKAHLYVFVFYVYYKPYARNL